MQSLRKAACTGQFTLDSYGLSVKNARSLRKKNAQRVGTSEGQLEGDCDKEHVSMDREKGLQILAELKATMI